MKIYLREIRKDKKMSVRKLSEISGVSKTHIDNIEIQKRIPTICVLHKLTKALG